MQLYYQVILGSVAMERAAAQLLRVFGADEDADRRKGNAAIAAVLVDRTGRPLKEKSVAVSSFAWSLPLALSLKLDALGSWPSVEQRLVQELGEILQRKDPEGRILPLDTSTINSAYQWLLATFGLPHDLVQPPGFVLRVYQYYKAKNPPEVQLLNSFYLGDLSSAAAMARSGNITAGLRAYLGVARPVSPIDLLTDQAALERAVAPERMPAGRWPSPGGNPLVLLQQAAVNLARQELGQREGILAVNGPPGTGKTTLLRDLVAAAVVDRALAMAAFDDPEAAFTSSRPVKTGGGAGFPEYRLHASLRGHEIVVASSNNKAVENVSRELPASKALGRTDLSFFKSISDYVHSPDGEQDGPPVQQAETWGMVAAVLGNKKNLAAFSKRFWWSDDRSFRVYLNAAKGDEVFREWTDEGTGQLRRERPAVLEAEAPPSREQARANWARARSRLLALEAEIQGELAGLERVRQTCLQRSATRREIAQLSAWLVEADERLAAAQDRLRAVVGEVAKHRSECALRLSKVEKSRARGPGWLGRLVRPRRWIKWRSAHAALVASVSEAKRVLELKQGDERRESEIVERIREQMASTRQLLAAAQRKLPELDAAIEAIRPKLGERLVDEGFFARGHVPSNLTAPWLPNSLHLKRGDLFAAAIEVHRAFIDVAAEKVLHNISALMGVFMAGPPADPEKRALLPDMWSTLFMAVPLISTTFASVERMFGGLSPGSIGWLLIDEAGQAVPQAAVGAIMRSKRAIVVGDPLQVPPVVTLPQRLTHEICSYFRVSASTWGTPEASAQTVADAASAFQATFRSDQGPRRVGVPLLVHRRCQEPMFGISNRIAYDGQMVHAVPASPPSAVRSVLGPSRWLDIDGEADTKWCAAEGEVVIWLLRQLASGGVANPDLFVITPFRIVAHEMRRRLEGEGALAAQFGIDIRAWVRDRVGTIHTFQGREAESVILVLGAPAAAQAGARAWAASTPNILNVAVSRAKQNLYVVGSYAAWSGIGHARALASLGRDRLGQ